MKESAPPLARDAKQLPLLLLVLNAGALVSVSWSLREVRATIYWVLATETALRTNELQRSSLLEQLTSRSVELYSDLACDHCRLAAPHLIMARDSLADVDWVYRPVTPDPLRSSLAFTSALLTVCAAEAGAVWDVFEAAAKHVYWTEESLFAVATQVGLQEDSLKRCMTSPETEEAVWRSRFRAASLNIRATPTLVIGAAKLEGYQSFEHIMEFVRSAGGPIVVSTPAR